MPVSAFVSSISGKGPLLFCHRIPLRLLGRGDRADQDLLFFLIQLPPRNPPVCDREEGSVRCRKDLGDLAVPGGYGGVSRVRASNRRVGPLDSLGDGGLRLNWEGTLSCRWSGDTTSLCRKDHDALSRKGRLSSLVLAGDDFLRLCVVRSKAHGGNARMDCGLKEKDPSALRILCKVKVPRPCSRGDGSAPAPRCRDLSACRKSGPCSRRRCRRS